jgi:transposase
VLDNGAFHKAKSLKIPSRLIFLPPYSPELNPAEKMWAQYKRAFSNLFCESLEKVSDFITNFTSTLTKHSILKTCSFDYVFFETMWTK